MNVGISNKGSRRKGNRKGDINPSQHSTIASVLAVRPLGLRELVHRVYDLQLYVCGQQKVVVAVNDVEPRTRNGVKGFKPPLVVTVPPKSGRCERIYDTGFSKLNTFSWRVASRELVADLLTPVADVPLV